MRSTNKTLPGPAGTSCLTCKRRHKKCDRTKPVCDRCSKGGYECLGYGHNKSNGYTFEEALSPSSRSRSVLPASSVSLLSPRTDDSPRNDETLISHDKLETDVHADNQQPGTAHTHVLALFNEDAVIYDTFPPTRAKTRNGLPLPLGSVDTTIPQRPVFPTSPLLFELASRMSRSVSIPLDVQNITEYVISHWDRMMNITYFTPPGEQIEKFSRVSRWRMATSSFARQGMLIDARIHESILEGNHFNYSGEFTRWIEEFEQAVLARLNEPMGTCELQERLRDILEMFFAKSRLLNAATTYELFRRVASHFLQMIYSDPTLWSSQSDPILVSIAHLLASVNYGPPSYMVMDIMGSMIYGLPQLVDYNTNIKLFHAEPHPVEWIDCFPGEFMILLAKINACRDQRSTEDWQDIERELVSWEPRPKFQLKGLESWKSVAWLALQETWKQTLLMYLYLAVCCVPTDDPRIQLSLRQIFQLIGTIRRQDPPGLNVHVFAQCLITGICSRTEKHRRLVRERLGCAAETRFWMFRGPEIVPILDHLWLGAGMEGKPVTWNDYLHSRHTVLPLSS
ncbi:fungal Zn(2)-cys(6) binuclear cluster domain protein, putative [Rhizoctonia solani AG-3 Rhs1AP]|uniref:Fungal Zn(2)-cys(6) binuclear cluster domain protein, putative n=1 Tax=Rhizoctonia solani AG-3 Rhs1AP TaxID=1086054 RepID=X8IU38_9AGAM|nr:fungal Zn(2)-cys(6) binuclear cluster domain protein, putative [Rhizoctonia solani AG-3 Rhs1AP]